MKPRSIVAGLGVLVVLVAAVLNQSAVHWRVDIADEHLFAYHGWCIAQGARPYLDVWDNKPPGIWWLGAAGMRLCGPGVQVEVLLGSLGLLLTIVGFLECARALYGRRLLPFALLLAVVFLTDLRSDCGGHRTETYVSACEVVGIACYLHYLRRLRLTWLILAGLAVGTAPLFKQSGVAAATACTLHLVTMRWRSAQGFTLPRSLPARQGRHGIASGTLPAWFAACAVMPLMALLALVRVGALGEAAWAVGGFNRAYFAVGDATWWPFGHALQVATPALQLFLAPAALALLGAVVTLVQAKRGTRSPAENAPTRHRAGVALVSLWLLLVVYLALSGPGRSHYHFMPALAPLGLLVLLPLHVLAGRRSLRVQLTARPAVAVLFLLWSCVVLAHARGSGVELTKIWATKRAWWQLDWRTPPPYVAQGRVVQRLTQPADTLYVWGWSPGTYRFALRLPVSRFTTLEKGGQVGAYADFIRAGAIADIQACPPTVFVIAESDAPALARGSTADFAAWVAAHYRLPQSVEGNQIRLRLP